MRRRRLHTTWRRKSKKRMLGMMMKDTIKANKVINDADQLIDFQIREVTFSTQGTERTVQLEMMKLNILPTLSNTAIGTNAAENVAISFYPLADGTNEVPLAPYRLVSNVNPAKFYIDFRRAGKLCPALRTPILNNLNTVVARMKFTGNQIESPRKITYILTTYYRTLHETEQISGPTAVKTLKIGGKTYTKQPKMEEVAIYDKGGHVIQYDRFPTDEGEWKDEDGNTVNIDYKINNKCINNLL